LIAVLLGALVLASCATADVSSPPPTSDDITAATTFLAGTNEADGKKGNETWTRAIVLNTHYKKDSWSTDWSMGVLLPDGKTKVFSDAVGSDKDQLNTGVTVGDYVIIKDDAPYVSETDVTVIKKAAVTIKGGK
jgi:hypothetical protein